MAYLVETYIGETRKAARPTGFSSRNAALQFMVDAAASARSDGFRVDGDPLDGQFSIHDDDVGRVEFETYVLTETSDPQRLRRARA
jgi:hypothetical protein